MVDYKEIENIINNILEKKYSLSVKCKLTVSEMREQLSGISYNDQFNELKQEGLLNPLEVDDYKSLLNLKRIYENQWDKFQEYGGDDKFTLENYEKTFQDIDDQLFYYGRRLIEGMKPQNPVPDIDVSKFEEDDQWGGKRGNNYEWFHEQGHLESSQIEAQQKSLDININLNEDNSYQDKRLLAMDNYFNGDVMGLNYKISHEGYLNRLSKEHQKQIKDIDNLMKKSPGLLQDTILYRGGHFDIHLREGDVFKFKGYVSTTFQRETSDIYKKDDEPDMTYIIHAPQGTKGICGSDKRFYNNNWEHEYVLPRNVEFVVLGINYEDMTVDLGIKS